MVRHADGLDEAVGWSEEPAHWARVVATRVGRDELLAAGEFTVVTTTIFPYVYHFDTVDHWLHHMHIAWPDQRVDSEVVARARAALTQDGDELILEEQVQAMLLQRS